MFMGVSIPVISFASTLLDLVSLRSRLTPCQTVADAAYPALDFIVELGSNFFSGKTPRPWVSRQESFQTRNFFGNGFLFKFFAVAVNLDALFLTITNLSKIPRSARDCRRQFPNPVLRQKNRQEFHGYDFGLGHNFSITSMNSVAFSLSHSMSRLFRRSHLRRIHQDYVADNGGKPPLSIGYSFVSAQIPSIIRYPAVEFLNDAVNENALFPKPDTPLLVTACFPACSAAP
jgi:hypothetical protein